MTTWHWVRHAPTHAPAFVGWRDVPADLSDTARVARLAAALPAHGHLVSSDLRRSVETADALEGRGLRRLRHQPGLREINFGRWDGLHHSAVSERDPDLSRAFWETPGTIEAPGGESWDAASDRVRAAVLGLNARFPGADIVAVAHFGVILTQIQRARGITAAETLGQRIDNLSVTRISWQAGSATVAEVNHCP